MRKDSDIVIKLKNVSKIYPLYSSRIMRLKEALHPFNRKYHRDFYALKNINLEVKKGEVVYFHNLYTATQTLTAYAITAKGRKVGGQIRILKQDENVGWRDANDYEDPVYNLYIRKKLEEIKDLEGDIMNISNWVGSKDGLGNRDICLLTSNKVYDHIFNEDVSPEAFKEIEKVVRKHLKQLETKKEKLTTELENG